MATLPRPLCPGSGFVRSEFPPTRSSQPRAQAERRVEAQAAPGDSVPGKAPDEGQHTMFCGNGRGQRGVRDHGQWTLSTKSTFSWLFPWGGLTPDLPQGLTQEHRPEHLGHTLRERCISTTLPPEAVTAQPNSLHVTERHTRCHSRHFHITSFPTRTKRPAGGPELSLHSAPRGRGAPGTGHTFHWPAGSSSSSTVETGLRGAEDVPRME